MNTRIKKRIVLFVAYIVLVLYQLSLLRIVTNNEKAFIEEALIKVQRKTINQRNKSWWRGKIHDDQISENDFTSNGARHPNGTLGMIVDPSPHRLQLPLDDPKKNPLFCPPTTTTSQDGFEGEEAYLVLQKVQRGIINSKAFLENINIGRAQHEESQGADDGNEQKEVEQVHDEDEKNILSRRRRKSRILCMIYTAHLPHSNSSNLRSQAETWGRQCDGFIAASNFTDHSIGAIDLVHNGYEEYANMWQKTRSMLAYAYHHYLEEFDFFHLCGDDVYISIDNMRAYFDGPEVLRLENGYIDLISRSRFHKPKVNETASMRPRPLIFGYPMIYKRDLAIAGGPGYTVNRAALRIFGERVLSNFDVDSRDSQEDFFVSGGLRQEGIYLSDTLDTTKANRYGEHASFKFDCLFHKDLEQRIPGFECHYGDINATSEQKFAFHLKNAKRNLMEGRTIPELMHRYHAVLNALCKN